MNRKSKGNQMGHPKFFKIQFRTKIRLGDHILSSNPDCFSNVCSLPYQEYSVAQAMIHPFYKAGGFLWNDIAVLQLDRLAQQNSKNQFFSIF
jgi:hypothetical protein